MDGQSLYDISIQETGTAENAISIAIANDLSLTDDLIAGSLLSIPDGIGIDNKVKSYFDLRSLKPASGITGDLYQDGIEFWGIENDFIVS